MESCYAEAEYCAENSAYQLLPTHEEDSKNYNSDIGPGMSSSTPDILIQHTCMAETSLLESSSVKNQVRLQI